MKQELFGDSTSILCVFRRVGFTSARMGGYTGLVFSDESAKPALVFFIAGYGAVASEDAFQYTQLYFV
jgi:hypothetical protein